ncbi:unnamed protein product [Knipowitschia caucasica]|uniref:Retinoic acid induced 2 n=1 Tax=Knipowitschia caucasica TaxID=637954 RepID=A0AAV2KZL0_KNICA
MGDSEGGDRGDSEGRDRGDMSQPQTGGSTEAPEQMERSVPEEDLKTGVGASGCSAEEPEGLKVTTALLHPLCLGEGPLVLPLHLQMNGGPQLGAAPYLITSQSPMSLVLEQHMGPSGIPQGPNCGPLPLQSSVLCPGALPFSLSAAAEQKTSAQTLDPHLLSLLQNPAFAAILQDLFPPRSGTSACQAPGSPFFPAPPLTPPYSSPLAPLVPPATLLVPYPVIIPLPVPLPIPLPVPVPVPSQDSKGNLPKPVCTVSTQTCVQDSVPSGPLPPHTVPPSEEVLDLSVKCPIRPKLEPPCPAQQDSVLDLSVPGARTRPADSKDLGGLASVELRQQPRWDSSSLGQDPPLKQDAPLGMPGSPQVIVSVKDAIPAILCGKMKGLSGVSSKNFSIKRDAAQSLQQLYGGQGGHHDPHDPHLPHDSHLPHDLHDPLKKASKSRSIKLKKVSSQEIHFLPMKKQRLAALPPPP